MNIFYLSDNPTLAAQYQCDKHVVKMILESAQLLCTAHRELDGNMCSDCIYKATHKNHPCAIWTRESIANYYWLYNHFAALCCEYTIRYGKVHTCETKLTSFLYKAPKNINISYDFTFPPQCMPDEYKHKDTVTAYRQYYALDKGNKDWFVYEKSRGRPSFIENIQKQGSFV